MEVQYHWAMHSDGEHMLYYEVVGKDRKLMFSVRHEDLKWADKDVEEEIKHMLKGV